MNPDDSGRPDSASDSGPSLESVMAEYLEQAESGARPDPVDYLRRYPHHAGELQSFFRNHQWLGSGEPSQPPSLVGQQAGPYRIETEIARGGMGVVYRAVQEGLDRPVALKLISSGVLAGDEERRRFRKEAEAAARLEHPGIVAIHEIGSWQGHEYFSMTLVDGPTLQQHVEGRRLDCREAARIVRDIARAAGYAHRAGIVHRDLKPENILLSENDRPLIADFGLAKWHRDGTMITRTGQVLGTPHYMSPQQATGSAAADASADIYSIGAILYALLTGQPPHIGESTAEVLRSVLQDEPKTPRQVRRDVPIDLESICLKAIAYEPGGRYRTADELADDLDRFLAGEPPTASGTALIDRVAREMQRDQHQTSFVYWSRSIVLIGAVIFFSHVAIFVLEQSQFGRPLAVWLPRAVMLGAIIAIIYRARDGALLPRSIAERPVWSIWIGYLAALGMVNLLMAAGLMHRGNILAIGSVLTGFGFIAMAGHAWAGSAIFGAAFLLAAPVIAWFPPAAPLLYGTLWLVSLLVLARHYRQV